MTQSQSNNNTPPKLSQGDEIRVIAPARSLSIVNDDVQEYATDVLESMGFTVSIGEHVNESNQFNSTTIDHRLADLHAAFKDDNVDAILTAIGGYNSNQLLNKISYTTIQNNPTILCGYSDITAVANAILAQTSMITYHGPHFSTLGMKEGADYNHEYFRKCLCQPQPYKVSPSQRWSDDPWYEQNQRSFHENPGRYVINEGTATGRITGGSISTYTLLNGTDYQPTFNNILLFLEDSAIAGERSPEAFDRWLQSIIHQEWFNKVEGICIGRFRPASMMTRDKLRHIITTKPALESIPVLAGLDFGHTDQMFTFPIGGQAKITAVPNNVTVQITHH